jgi:prepilin-type N-terminal cleavage/methylation domain-containing protein
MRSIKINKSKKGFTLIELIISIAILSIISIFIFDSFLFSTKLLSKSAGKKIKSMDASSGIELGIDNTLSTNPDTTINRTAGSFTLNFGNSNISVNGSYIKGSNSTGEVVYKSFVPGP